MGDLIGTAVEGTLYYVPKREFDRIKGVDIDPARMIELYSNAARINTLYMIATAGSGHIGSSFSSMEIAATLYCSELDSSAGDVYFSSKGHDAPGLYAVLIAEGVLEEEKIHRLRRLGGLPGHPDVHVPGMETNTGSLGMGISKAKGMLFASRFSEKNRRIFVMTGDGELQEGQIWESLFSAATDGLNDLTVIVDHNKIQSDFSVESTMSLGDLDAKFAAFGWYVVRIDGHDTTKLLSTFEELRQVTDRPKVIIADTIKGRGVSFMEGTSVDSDVELFRFHSGAPGQEDYMRAVEELIGQVNSAFDESGAQNIELESVEVSAPTAPNSAEQVKLFPAYTAALLDQARSNESLVVLDADLRLDMGLLPFCEEFPDRFVECGIAEMDMVSQAGGMALNGLVPIVHSFSCFLSTRPNEQIYNNATEKTKIVYVGGLSGVLPAGPGHSHQSVREISAVGGIPGMIMVEPSCPEEVGPLFDWCVNTHKGPSFLRLISIPVTSKFALPSGYRSELGRGCVVRQGADDIVLISAGVLMLSEAVQAADKMFAEASVDATVVNLPWLNYVDSQWLAEITKNASHVIVVDNHYESGGQGDYVLSALAQLQSRGAVRGHKFGLNDVPPSGTNNEVLNSVGLDSASLARRIVELI